MKSYDDQHNEHKRFFFIKKRTFQGRPKILNCLKRSSCLMSSLFKNFDVKKKSFINSIYRQTNINYLLCVLPDLQCSFESQSEENLFIF